MVCNVCRNWGNRRPSCFKVLKPSEGSKVQREKLGEHLNFCLIPLLFHWPHLSPSFSLVPTPPGDLLLFLTQYPYYWLFNPLLAPPSQGSYIMRTRPNRGHLIASLHFCAVFVLTKNGIYMSAVKLTTSIWRQKGLSIYLTLTVLVTTVDALGHFETG